jgi:NAD(P)-dependent dehydrogenase (short-subunit alcohol dehydrogenase family)
MDLQLKNKTALVTGSTLGIGLAIAKSLLAEGAKVYINGRNKERVTDTVNTLKALFPNGEIVGVAADFSSVDDINNLLKAIPTVDILVNNVGIFEPKNFVDIPDEDWFRFYEVNVMSGVRLSRHYFPKMLAQNWGRIIFISSESSIMIPEEMIHYGMTKTAQLAISRGLAELTKGTNVTVNSVLPGPTKSEGVGTFIKDLAKSQNLSDEEMEQKFFETARPSSLIQRFADVQEIANLVTYVASPISSATNGTALRADGGLVKSII